MPERWHALPHYCPLMSWHYAVTSHGVLWRHGACYLAGTNLTHRVRGLITRFCMGRLELIKQFYFSVASSRAGWEVEWSLGDWPSIPHELIQRLIGCFTATYRDHSNQFTSVISGQTLSLSWDVSDIKCDGQWNFWPWWHRVGDKKSMFSENENYSCTSTCLLAFLLTWNLNSNSLLALKIANI